MRTFLQGCSIDKEEKRILWIDCAKLIAIIAVVVDHCNNYAYHNQVIANASYFSVSLFVLLSGIALGMSSRRRTFIYQLKKVGTLFVSYAIASAIVLLWNDHVLDAKIYLTHLVNFSAQAPYYFFVFFFQLLLVTPYLLDWFLFCRKSKYSIFLHIVTLSGLCYLSSLTIRFTFILPVHGGGQFLLGGTYLTLYYFGIVLSDAIKKVKTVRQRTCVLVVSTFCWIGWLQLRVNGKLIFDKVLSPYFGSGFNPPSFELSVYSVLTLFVLFSFFSLLENISDNGLKKIIKLIARGGAIYIIYLYVSLIDWRNDKVLLPSGRPEYMAY